MASASRVLAIDVGAGTQDILLYESSKPVENCVKMILPSQTSLVAGKIRQATAEGYDIFLTGNLMGGGPCVSAMKRHIRAGFSVYATPLAAKTIRDNLGRISHIQLADNPGRNEPGTGEINFTNLFRFIDEAGYTGWIGCEYKPAGVTEEGLGWAKPYLKGGK